MKVLICFSLALLLSSPAFANQTWAFKTIDPKSFPDTKEQMSLSNLPRVRTQDSFGICYGFTTATVAQYYYCKINKISSCKDVPPDKEVSPVGASTLAHLKDGEGWGSSAAHTALSFTNSGSSTTALYSLAAAKFTLAESCFPFDPIANKYGNDPEKLNQLVERLQSLYKRSRTEAGTCIDCIKETMNKGLNVKLNAKDIQHALKKSSFEDFLYAATLERGQNYCEDLIGFDDNPPEVGAFPEEAGVSYDAFIAQIKDVLKSGYPLNMGGICPISEGDNCISGAHGVVITGYRKQCTKAGVCREVLRVQNSWGEEWQRQNDDGWVDAKSLIGNKPIGTGVLAWWKPSSPIK